jgi:hypothetical protein
MRTFSVDREAVREAINRVMDLGSGVVKKCNPSSTALAILEKGMGYDYAE